MGVFFLNNHEAQCLRITNGWPLKQTFKYIFLIIIDLAATIYSFTLNPYKYIKIPFDSFLKAYQVNWLAVSAQPLKPVSYLSAREVTVVREVLFLFSLRLQCSRQLLDESIVSPLQRDSSPFIDSEWNIYSELLRIQVHVAVDWRV